MKDKKLKQWPKTGAKRFRNFPGIKPRLSVDFVIHFIFILYLSFEYSDVRENVSSLRDFVFALRFRCFTFPPLNRFENQIFIKGLDGLKGTLRVDQ